jgi:hypothetical protein
MNAEHPSLARRAHVEELAEHASGTAPTVDKPNND